MVSAAIGMSFICLLHLQHKMWYFRKIRGIEPLKCIQEIIYNEE